MTERGILPEEASPDYYWSTEREAVIRVRWDTTGDHLYYAEAGARSGWHPVKDEHLGTIGLGGRLVPMTVPPGEGQFFLEPPLPMRVVWDADELEDVSVELPPKEVKPGETYTIEIEVTV